MVANFLKFSRDPEMSEGPDSGLGVQIDTVEKRTINVEKHCFDHGGAHFEGCASLECATRALKFQRPPSRERIYLVASNVADYDGRKRASERLSQFVAS